MFHNNFKKHDEYTTPDSAWEALKDIIPKGTNIWMPFYCDGSCGRKMRKMGFKVHHKPNEDFFQEFWPRQTRNSKWMVIDNPPFSKTKEVLQRLVDLDLPFILIMPTNRLCTVYFQKIFMNKMDKPQIIIPKKRIKFTKHIDGDYRGGCKQTEKIMPFDTYYYCWKLGLKRDLSFI